jgi:hypothetical protein
LAEVFIREFIRKFNRGLLASSAETLMSFDFQIRNPPPRDVIQEESFSALGVDSGA